MNAPANWTDSNGSGYFDEGDVIIVTGYVYTAAYGSGVGGGGGGGLGGLENDTTSITPTAGDEVIPAKEPLATPCVDTTFATPNVSLTDANRSALAASNTIKGREYDEFEYSSIVFFDNGKVGFTEPYEAIDEEQVNFLGSIGAVPTGAIILGIVHNHPEKGDSRVDDSYPSRADWNGYDQIQALSSSGRLPRGITADANMLLYMLSDQEDMRNKTYVYDNTDKTQRTRSCSLQ